ncbi:MAG: hypothetical protein ACR2NY_03215, partial [Alphaproteobacteria bacterium]
MKKKLSSLLFALATLFLLVGCGPDEFGIFWRPSGTAGIMVGNRDGGQYFISSDEPYAVLIGNKTFLENGNAVDALVATSIALTATQPLSTSLGAGGACQALLPTIDGDIIPYSFSFSGATPADSMISAMYQIHQQHGHLPWEKIVAPAEKLLRLGIPDNIAIQLQKDNPIWQYNEEGLIINPALAEAFSTLRLR